MRASNEPAITTAIIVSIVGAFITLLTVFGLPLTDEQVQAILGFVLVVGPLVSGFLTRRLVYGPETVRRERRERHGH